jgi:hypothetical protein
MHKINIEELDTPFVFRSRPEAIPGDFRPLWRIGILLLILFIASRGSRSSSGRLHVLNWAIRTPDNRQTLINLIDGKTKPDTIVVRIEPSLNRAVNLAFGEGLVDRVSNRISLTLIGQKAAKILYNETNIFIEEKKFLEVIGKRLTEQLVQHLLSGRL